MKNFGIIALIIFGALGQATAGDINGHLYSPLGAPMSEVSIVVNQDGDQGGSSQASTWAATPVGWYGFGNLPAGPYTMLLNEKDHSWRHIITGLKVPETGKIEVDYRMDYSDYLSGLTWQPELAADYYQSFMATGTSINMVSLHQAIEPGPNTTISILDGSGTKGKQIGPTRTIPTSINNPSAAYWSAGEVPTVPGKLYTVHLSVPGGQRPFLGGAKIRGGNAFPDGHTWVGDKMIDTPIKIVIGEDNDGVITTVSTQKSNSNLVPLKYHSVTTLGQTFTGKGSSVLSVSVLTGATDGKLIASVHDVTSANGEGGKQIGPAKLMKTIDWNNRGAVVWKPGEVPITKGHVYYMKLRRPDGKPFTIYHCEKNEYAGGTMYLDGKDSGTDLSTTIACEEYTGSLNVKKIGITDVTVTRSAISAKISWKTTVPSDSCTIDYGPSTPYTNTIRVTGGHGAYTANLKLAPNTLYHYRITARADGYRDGRTADMVFITEPIAPNLIENPGFELGNLTSLSSWKTFGSGDSGVRNFEASGENKWFFDAKAHTGKFFYGGVSNGGDCKGGVYQQIDVKAGKPIKASAWLWTYQVDGFGKFFKETVVGRIGIDPTGGTNPRSKKIVWCMPVIAQNLFGDGKGIWTEIATTANPTGTKATIFIEGGADSPLAWTVYGLDDVVVTQE